jgi:four helix bundle protein
MKMEEIYQSGRPNIIREKAFSFATNIVLLTRKLKAKKVEADMVNQLLRSGTSVSANIEEANAAISRAEFSSKISLAFKEARETQFWLKLLLNTDSMTAEEFQPINKEIDEILRLLWAILKKTRMKKEDGRGKN